MFWGGFQPQPPKAKRGRQKGTRKGKKTHAGTSYQGTSTKKTQIWKEKDIPSSIGLTIPKFYARRSDKLKKTQPIANPPTENMPPIVNSPHVEKPPTKISHAETHLQ